MSRLKLVGFLAVFVCAGVISGCGNNGGGGPQTGFKARGEKYVQVFGGEFRFVSFTSIQGTRLFDNGGATGNVSSFGPILSLGDFPVNDGRVPARWNIFAGLPQAECIGYLEPTQRDVTAHSTQVSRCVTFGVIFPFASTPASINLQAPAATFEMTGEGLSSAYGMPYIEYVDQYTGQIIGSTTATAVNGKGTWLQAAMPNLSSVYSGTYNILVSNVLADGSREYVGTSTVQCYGRDVPYDPPPDPGPCGCPPDLPCLPCEINY